nr:MAG TPA: AAA domain protein [Caudoviricetes sp.]
MVINKTEFVAIAGAHSVGKTTILKQVKYDLEKVFGYRVGVLDSSMRLISSLERVKKNSSFTRQSLGALHYISDLYFELANGHNEIVLCDRSIYDFMAYSKLYLKPGELSDFYKLVGFKEEDWMYSYLYFKRPDYSIPVEEDGVRPGVEEQKLIDGLIASIIPDNAKELPLSLSESVDVIVDDVIHKNF